MRNMKRGKLVKHLNVHGVYLVCEGASHSYFRSEKTGKRTFIPQHNEIKDLLAKKICEKDLRIPFVR